jgi:alkanesulfonate monooxygenase SsuD/methylene tetrahydromethanopterin reductase-like flavin-dependent oxidoreductase (luciferase family)
MRLGVAFGWHVHPWETLLGLVRRAEELGFAAAFVDGDISMLDSTRPAEVLHGWTTTTALLAHTERIEIGSIRLVHHWNAAQLAQATASAERLFPGRLRMLISVGDRPHDERFGLRVVPKRERVEWLDETLGALRALWRGDEVSRAGNYVRLDRARVQPAALRAGAPLPIAVAGRGPRLLQVVARHADIWDINLPPIPQRVAAATETLQRACEGVGRDSAQIARSMWIFARVSEAGQSTDRAQALAAFRRLNPWFHWIPDSEAAAALVVGSADSCRQQLAQLAESLALELPTVDLSGLDAASSHAVLEALAPEKQR